MSLVYFTPLFRYQLDGPTVSWIVTNNYGDGLETVVVVDGNVNGEVDVVDYNHQLSTLTPNYLFVHDLFL